MHKPNYFFTWKRRYQSIKIKCVFGFIEEWTKSNVK